MHPTSLLSIERLNPITKQAIPALEILHMVQKSFGYNCDCDSSKEQRQTVSYQCAAASEASTKIDLTSSRYTRGDILAFANLVLESHNFLYDLDV